MKLVIKNENGLTRIDYEIGDVKDYIVLQDGERCTFKKTEKLEVDKKSGTITL